MTRPVYLNAMGYLSLTLRTILTTLIAKYKLMLKCFSNNMRNMNILRTKLLFTGVRLIAVLYDIYKELWIFFSAFRYRDNLQLVRLYIDTPVFDKITKDQSSKLEDRISTIGGNLGLLTGLIRRICTKNESSIYAGFSIISMVEVVYVASKMLFSFFSSKLISSRPSSNATMLKSNIITVQQTLEKEKAFLFKEKRHY